MALEFPNWGRLIRSWFGVNNPDFGRQETRPVSGGVSTGVEVSDSRAMQIAAVFSAIRLIAETCASLPLNVYRRMPDGSRKQVRDHRLANLLKRPNPFMTGKEYREAIYAQLAAWGNSYSEKVPNSRGEIIELWPLKPDAMVVNRNGYESLDYRYTIPGAGKVVQYAQSEVLHAKGFTLDGVTGMSPLGMARQALGLAVAAEDYAGGYYRNGGKPSGVLMIDKALKPDQEAALRKKFGGIAEGGESQGNRLWVLEAFAKYQPITIPPEDAQMLQTRQFQLAEIARFFRIPLFLLMETEKSTSWGTGLEQQDLGFLKYTLTPYLSRTEEAMNAALLSEAEQGEYYVEHNVEGLLRTDSAARATFYSTMVQNGLMTRNEVRMKENLPPLEGGDDLTAQTNLMPLEKLGQTPPASAGVPVSGDPDASQEPGS